ncbi:MAG: asparagine synthase (glutamine-hydrolyzing) [Planctomycetota bacterium]
MCGIAGIIRFDKQPIESDRLRDACLNLRHRGPDDSGTWLHEPTQLVGLAAVRLAILDPSPAGHQPMLRQNRFVLVHNGEIYNYRELRRELVALGEIFTTDSDTEVILAACIRWGTEAMRRFAGMWALAFYDTQTCRGFLARDRLGVKPLFYTANAKRLAFASELGPLTKLVDLDCVINTSAVVQHLQFGFIAGDHTIYAGAKRLEPGHVLSFDQNGSLKSERYYSLPVMATAKPIDYADACREVRRAIEQAVIACRVSHVPIGAFLSGGLDSSIVVYHLAAAIGRPIQTFSVGYDGHGAYDETPYARLVARHFGTDHHEFILSERDVLKAIPSILDHLGEPVGDSSIIPTALLAEGVRPHVTVALSGDGGDELFGGYWRYLGHGTLQSYTQIPPFIRHGAVEPILHSLSTARSSPMRNCVRQFRKLLRAAGQTSAIARHVTWSKILSPDAKSIFSDLAVCGETEEWTLQRARALLNGAETHDELNSILAFDLQHQLPADMLQKVDLASMMHSLEVRVPLLEHAVVELATSLPSSYKIDRGVRKRILLDAYRGLLPDEILGRPKKGFEVPIGEYLRGPLKSYFFDIVDRSTVESFGLLNFDRVFEVYEQHRSRREDHADLLFALLSLCHWSKRK